MSDAGQSSDAAVLRRAVHTLQGRLRAQSSGGGIGPTALLVLGRLLRTGVASASELAEAEGLQPQSLTRALKSLEEAGLIDRGVDHDDHRRAAIAITATGESALREMLRGQIGWLGRALETELTPDERETVRAAAGLIERLAAGERTPLKRPVTDRVLNLVPSLSVADVARSVRFYEQLDFLADGSVEEGGRTVFASMHGRVQRAARIMFVLSDCAILPSSGMTLYCWTRDIVNLHQRLIAGGLAPGPVHHPEYMVDGEFRMTDPDGYAIAVGQIRPPEANA